jgi:hypothetical protein
VRSYPYRFSYKNIRFEVNVGLLAYIESNRQAMLDGVRSQVFTTIDAIQDVDIGLRAQLSNEVWMQHEISTVPKNLQLVDSFE